MSSSGGLHGGVSGAWRNRTVTSCPAGFVIPDNPTDPRVVWAVPDGDSSASGRGGYGRNQCAQPCTFRGYFDDGDEATFTAIFTLVPYIGLPLILCVIATWLMNPLRMRKQYLPFIFLTQSAIFTLIIAVTGTVTSNPSRFCHDNATEVDTSGGVGLCVVEAGITTYCLLSVTLCWTCQTVELFREIVIGRRKKSLFWVYMVVIFLLPLAAAVYGGMRGMYGYGRILPICMTAYHAPKNVDFEYLYIPVFVSSVVGTVCLVAVIAKICRLMSASATLVAPVGPTTGRTGLTGGTGPSALTAPTAVVVAAAASVADRLHAMTRRVSPAAPRPRSSSSPHVSRQGAEEALRGPERAAAPALAGASSPSFSEHVPSVRGVTCPLSLYPYPRLYACPI